MKSKLIFFTALIGLTLTSCGGGGGSSTPSKKSYLITFKDEVGTTLNSKEWEEGTTPSYTYNKQDSAEWDYTVEGWSTTLGGSVIEIPPVSEEATYYAVVSKVKQKYAISFFDVNGDPIKSENLEYGAQPSCDYTGPEDDAEYDYTFRGWLDENNQLLTSIPTVTKAASYYAKVDKTKNLYQIRFFTEDGEPIVTSNVAYGETPECDYKGKASNQEWTRTFKGWTTSLGGAPLTSLPAVTAAADYYAVVEQVKNKYTITFDSNSGSSVASITEEYGTSVNEPAKPTRDGYKFSGWTYDKEGGTAVTWPITLTENLSLVANWNEKVDIKGYLATLMDTLNTDPNDFIPDTMSADHNAITVDPSNYDYSNFNNLSKYGGFGEQWHMVLENIQESQRFYAVTTLIDTVITASVVAFNNYLDNNPGDTAEHSISETSYVASIEFKNGILKYSLTYTTGLDIPFFGHLIPQINMEYNVKSLEKSVRIQLSEKNAMKYIVNKDSYKFGIEYGVTTVSRKAYFEVTRGENDEVTGHIYEFVQYKDKDLVPSCADFYIDETYTSVVGNKASGIIGFSDYINELYDTASGKLLGYEIREEKTIAGKTITFNTLWFNLTDISGVSNIKYVDADHATDEMPTGFYLNNSTKAFESKLVGGLSAKTASRRYDIEMRKRYIYSKNESELIDNEFEEPMMFVQAEQLETFTADVNSKNSCLNLSISLAQKYLTKIQDDYGTLIEIFIGNKGTVDSDYIVSFIGVLNAPAA